ncbi:DUF2341 domain-containing protein [Methanococcus maripaludis]|uniref:DUF2341 domain-containing protein n=1 Tax=Methanococcus maripaludis TaxID=39152 RepID=A0A8T4CNQ0_METMI|nr:DUF2341 domain-containing protein [Methanococcus maripaludis]MBM7409987.1 hypothetical protein [Methanococcus maripaludis]MBP2219317.1 hypothetical protein [Methanococcus maripaludis]
MYLSQSTTTLVLLLLLTATLTYNTLDLQKNQVLTEMEASSIDLKSSSLEHIIESSLPTVFNRVLNDAELEVIDNYNNNPSGDPFFESTNYTLAYLKNGTEDIIVKDYLENVSEEYSNLGYTIDYNFSMTNITMVDGFTFKLDYDLYYKIQGNKGVIKEENISSFQYSTVKTVLDAYHYIKPTYVGVINVSNPNAETLYDFQVKVVFNDSNFDYSIEPTGEGLRFYDENGNYIPYWVEVWDYSDDDNDRTSVLWLKVPILDANTNTSVYILSTYPKISESNGNRVFEMFDDFEDSNSIYSKWNVYRGDWEYISNSNIYSNSIYNENIVTCQDAPDIARMISTENTSLSEYIVEVDSMGYFAFHDSTPGPYTMLGFFADPEYLAETTTHPDAFYSVDMSSVHGALFTLTGSNLIWDLKVFDIFFGLSKEYPVDYNNVLRTYVGTDFFNAPLENEWYTIKLEVLDDDIQAKYCTLEDYISDNEPDWMISEENLEKYGTYFELGTSGGSLIDAYDIYFDNFRVRKYASIEPTTNIYSLSKTVGINYITPPRAEGTRYVLGSDYNLYYEEADNYPSIIDMLAGEDFKSWEYGYGLKLKGYQ